MPVSGEVLEDPPERVNEDPFSRAWFVCVARTDLSEVEELMDVDEYREYVEGLE